MCIEGPAVGTKPGVGMIARLMRVRDNVRMMVSGSGGSVLVVTGAGGCPAVLGVPVKNDSGREDGTPCMDVRPGTEDGG